MGPRHRRGRNLGKMDADRMRRLFGLLLILAGAGVLIMAVNFLGVARWMRGSPSRMECAIAGMVSGTLGIALLVLGIRLRMAPGRKPPGR